MTARLSVDEVKLRLERTHGDVVTIDETTYTHVHGRARFFDREHGEWWANVASVLYGRRHTRHKSVAARQRMTHTIDDVKAKLAVVHGNVVSLVEGQTYHHSHQKMQFSDVTYGTWWAMPYLAKHGPVSG